MIGTLIFSGSYPRIEKRHRVGVGGSVPVIWSYFGKLISSNRRGRILSIIATFWMIGTLIFSGIGWIILPLEQIVIGGYVFKMWRIFVAVSTLLCLSSSLIVSFLPESPKFLVEKGRKKEALAILARIYASNTGNSEADFPVRRLADPDTTASHVVNERESSFRAVYRQTKFLFHPSLFWTTLVVIIINFCLSFGSYGLTFWLPELFSRSREAGSEGTLCQRIGNATLFASSSNTTTCTIPSSGHVDLSVYRDTFLVNLSSLPGNLATILLLDRLGRKPMFFAGALLSALSVEVLGLSCLFNATSVLCWNCMDAFAVELFPTEVRATALGFGLVFARLGAILGNNLFGLLIDQYCSVPIVLVAVMLSLAGLSSLKLKETTNIPLE